MNYRSIRTLKNGQKIIIENAKLKDAEEISQVINQVSNETRFLSRGEEDPVVTVEKEKKYIEEMDSSAFLIAKIDKKVVGHGILAVGKNSRNKHKAILGIAILKAYWRMGIGKIIMESLISCAKKLNLEQITLSVVSTNIGAIKLYNRFGFEQVGFNPKAMKYPDGTYADFINMVKFL